MGKPIEHYTPQLLLRNFSNQTNQKQIFVYDKLNERSYPSAINKAGGETDFYGIELEKRINEIEGDAGEPIKNILKNQTLSQITIAEKEIIADFAALQMVRTPSFRMRRKAFSEEIHSSFLNNFGVNLNSQTPEYDFRKEHIQTIIETKNELRRYFLDKTWMLLKTNSSNPFYISDNPVVMDNFHNTGFFGNIGLAVGGIEIYMPLSKTLVLGFLCRTHQDYLHSGYKKINKLSEISPKLGDKFKNQNKDLSDKIEILLSAMNGIGYLECDIENLKRLNFLQVFYSEKYLYSSEKDFLMAKEILTKFPNTKYGLRNMIAD